MVGSLKIKEAVPAGFDAATALAVKCSIDRAEEALMD